MIRPVLDLTSTAAAAMSDAEICACYYGNTHQIVNRHEFDKTPRAQRIRALGKATGRIPDNAHEQLQAERAKRTAPPKEVDPVQLAEAITEYPRERCRELFQKEADAPGVSSSKLSAEEYAKAKMAARHWGILRQPTGEPAVRFNYKRPADYRAERAANEAAEAATVQAEAGLSADGLPPGVWRNAKGEMFLADAQAFADWQARAAARAVIAQAK